MQSTTPRAFSRLGLRYLLHVVGGLVATVCFNEDAWMKMMMMMMGIRMRMVFWVVGCGSGFMRRLETWMSAVQEGWKEGRKGRRATVDRTGR